MLWVLLRKICSIPVFEAIFDAFGHKQAFAALDFENKNLEEGIGDSPPNQGVVKEPNCSSLPLRDCPSIPI
jgi:hypothetical protein